MSWPGLLEFVPAPLRGGPVPPDVEAVAWPALREAWRRQAAKRVHGAEDRALALVLLPPALAPHVVLFDGRSLEVASGDHRPGSAAPSGSALQGLPLPGAGMLMRHGGVSMWRDSLTGDAVERIWRGLGGDEAFALSPLRRSPASRAGEAYALVRRGVDRARVELAPSDAPAGRDPENAPLARWAQRFAPYLRQDLHLWLLGGYTH